MAEQGYISRQQKDQAEAQELQFDTHVEAEVIKAPHFAFLAKEELIQRYGEQTLASSGFKVKTSINLDWQEDAEKVVADQVQKLAANQVSNGAAVVLDAQTGEILALVGSYDWNNEDFGKVDVTQSPRQPGFAFKPVVYAAALEEKAITPATVLKDQPTSYGGKETGSVPYSPQNYDRKFRGLVLARRALANSLNVPSVEVTAKIGVEKVREMVQRLGITTLTDPSQYGLSLTLGAGEVKLLELTGVYAVFANQGRKNTPTAILEVRGKNDQVVYTHQPTNEPVLEEVAFLISSILSDSQTRKEIFGNSLDNTIEAAVKTGTTESYRDSLTMGYSNKLAIGVWVGNNDGTAMDNVAGSLGAAPIWKDLMEKFSDGQKAQFNPPPDVVEKYVCRYNGLLLNNEATASGYLEYFLPGTEPTKICVFPTPTPVPPTPTPWPSIDKKVADCYYKNAHRGLSRWSWVLSLSKDRRTSLLGTFDNLSAFFLHHLPTTGWLVGIPSRYVTEFPPCSLGKIPQITAK